MALDSRYRWIFPVKDVHGRDATIGIGIEDGRVIVSAPRWFTFDDGRPELAEQVGYSLVTASFVARGQDPSLALSQRRPVCRRP